MKEVRLQTSGLVRVTNGKNYFTLKPPIQSARNVASAWFRPFPSQEDEKGHHVSKAAALVLSVVL